MIEGGWTNANRPRVLAHGGHTYIGWARGSDGGVGVDDTLITTFPPDTHNAPGLAVDPDDGHVLAFYCAHNGATVWMHDLDTGATSTVLSGGRYTYPCPFVWDGKLRLLIRDADGITWPGHRWRLATRDGSWSSEVVFSEPGRGIYVQPVVSEGRVDFAMGNNPVTHANAHIWHCYLDADGYHRTDGEDMGSPPFGQSDLSVVYSASDAFLHTIEPGPVIGFAAMDGAFTDQRLMVWDGSLHDLGVGGGTMALDWPRAYVGRESHGGGFHVWEWPNDRYIGPGIEPTFGDRLYWLTGRYTGGLDYRLEVMADPGPAHHSELVITEGGAQPPVLVYGEDADFVYSE